MRKSIYWQVSCASNTCNKHKTMLSTSGLRGRDMSTCMKTPSVSSAAFATRSSRENPNLENTRQNFTQLLCFKKTREVRRQGKMNPKEPWTSVLSARRFSRGQASWHSTCWSIQVWNRSNVTSVTRHLHGRPTCSCTSEPTQERSRMLALVAEDVSQTSLPLEDIVGHTQENAHTRATCVEAHLRKPAPFIITRRPAKGKEWTQQKVILRRWRTSASLIFSQPTTILNVILSCSQLQIHE